MTAVPELQPRPWVMSAYDWALHHSDGGPGEQARGDYDASAVSQAAFDGQSARKASPPVSKQFLLTEALALSACSHLQLVGSYVYTQIFTADSEAQTGYFAGRPPIDKQFRHCGSCRGTSQDWVVGRNQSCCLKGTVSSKAFARIYDLQV